MKVSSRSFSATARKLHGVREKSVWMETEYALLEARLKVRDMHYRVEKALLNDRTQKGFSIVEGRVQFGKLGLGMLAPDICPDERQDTENSNSPRN